MKDTDVRREIYDLTIRTGSVPSAADIAAALEASEDEIGDAFRRLAEQRIIVLDANGNIVMAAPFSAVPTPFVVRAGDRSYFANCIWDALGISPMLKKDSTIATSCPNCDEPLGLTVRDGELAGSDAGVVERKW